MFKDFNIGDRVRVVGYNGENGNYFVNGSVGVMSSGEWVVFDDGQDGVEYCLSGEGVWCVEPRFLELENSVNHNNVIIDWVMNDILPRFRSGNEIPVPQTVLSRKDLPEFIINLIEE